jgi:ATP-dependent exoDNAse (exonuclease V) alpha subunit
MSNMFHQGDLQSGISAAIQEQKLVACFIRQGTIGVHDLNIHVDLTDNTQTTMKPQQHGRTNGLPETTIQTQRTYLTPISLQ